jgi:hypothetical protein
MINLANIDSQKNFTPLPENWYDVECVKSEVTTSKTNKRMISAEFNVINHPKYNKRKVWNNFVLTDNSLWVLKTYVENAGLSDYASGDTTEEELAKAMIGTKLRVYVEPSGKNVNITNWAKLENNESGTSANSGMFQ